MVHQCKKCINYTKEIIESKSGFEIELDLCGFGMFFKTIPEQQQQTCLNYRIVVYTPIKTNVNMG